MAGENGIYYFLGLIANIVGLAFWWVIGQEVRFARVRKLAEELYKIDSGLVLEMIEKCQEIYKFWNIFLGRAKKARWISRHGVPVSKKNKKIMQDVFAGISILDHIHLDRMKRHLKKGKS